MIRWLVNTDSNAIDKLHLLISVLLAYDDLSNAVAAIGALVCKVSIQRTINIIKLGDPERCHNLLG